MSRADDEFDVADDDDDDEAAVDDVDDDDEELFADSLSLLLGELAADFSADMLGLPEPLVVLDVCFGDEVP